MERLSKNPNIFQIKNSSSARTLSRFNGVKAYLTIETADAYSPLVTDSLREVIGIKNVFQVNRYPSRDPYINILAEIQTSSTAELGKIVFDDIHQINGIVKTEIHPIIS